MFQEDQFSNSFVIVWHIFPIFPQASQASSIWKKPDDVNVLTPTTWNLHSDTYML